MFTITFRGHATRWAGLWLWGVTLLQCRDSLGQGFRRARPDFRQRGMVVRHGREFMDGQMPSTLNTAVDSRVTLVNGAQAGNVFWQVGSSATIGVRTDFYGSILADQSITVNSEAQVLGALGATRCSDAECQHHHCPDPGTSRHVDALRGILGPVRWYPKESTASPASRRRDRPERIATGFVWLTAGPMPAHQAAPAWAVDILAGCPSASAWLAQRQAPKMKTHPER